MIVIIFIMSLYLKIFIDVLDLYQDDRHAMKVHSEGLDSRYLANKGDESRKIAFWSNVRSTFVR